jgi:excisionase family DNA binding protein
MRKETNQQPALEDFLLNAVRRAFDRVIEEKTQDMRLIDPILIPEKDEYLSQREACSFLRIHPSTIIRWRKQNLIPFHRIGKSIMYSKNELIRSSIPGNSK